MLPVLPSLSNELVVYGLISIIFNSSSGYLSRIDLLVTFFSVSESYDDSEPFYTVSYSIEL